MNIDFGCDRLLSIIASLLEIYPSCRVACLVVLSIVFCLNTESPTLNSSGKVNRMATKPSMFQNLSLKRCKLSNRHTIHLQAWKLEVNLDRIRVVVKIMIRVRIGVKTRVRVGAGVTVYRMSY
jgi:hypothetical protein